MTSSSNNSGNRAPMVVVASVLAGAAFFAIFGTLLPGLAGITGAPAIWIPIVFYGVAVVDVLIALWLWRKLKALRQSAPGGTGPVQRQ
ncbi:MAG TPA: hypothetical protein VGF43_17015 [Dongiaceae bacterium]|jgi:protein-S-isoprenylcysteine O-methyltransferase Ste14